MRALWKDVSAVITVMGVVSLGLLVGPAVPALADGTVSGSGTVNAIKAAERKINITHGPIAELKWPGMTMDFGVSKAVSLDRLKVGTAVVFELLKEADGSFVIQSLKPVISKPGSKTDSKTGSQTMKMKEHSHGH